MARGELPLHARIKHFRLIVLWPVPRLCSAQKVRKSPVQSIEIRDSDQSAAAQCLAQYSIRPLTAPAWQDKERAFHQDNVYFTRLDKLTDVNLSGSRRNHICQFL